MIHDYVSVINFLLFLLFLLLLIIITLPLNPVARGILTLGMSNKF